MRPIIVVDVLNGRSTSVVGPFGELRLNRCGLCISRLGRDGNRKDALINFPEGILVPYLHILATRSPPHERGENAQRRTLTSWNTIKIWYAVFLVGGIGLARI